MPGSALAIVTWTPFLPSLVAKIDTAPPNEDAALGLASVADRLAQTTELGFASDQLPARASRHGGIVTYAIANCRCSGPASEANAPPIVAVGCDRAP
jgi:hypothetical protein